MKNNLLLPHSYRRIGFIILPFAATWLVVTGLLNTTVFEFLKITSDKKATHNSPFDTASFLFSKGFSADLNLTCAIILTIVSLFMVAFAKEKREDEYVRMVRLRSLQISTYANYFILLLATIFLYDQGFFTVMEFNLFTTLILFIIVYYYELHIKPYFTKTTA